MSNVFAGVVPTAGGDLTVTFPERLTDGLSSDKTGVAGGVLGAGTYHGYWTMDLGADALITSLTLHQYGGVGLSISVEASVDGVTWTPVGTAAAFAAAAAGDFSTIAVSATARYWRMVYTATLGGLGYFAGVDVYELSSDGSFVVPAPPAPGPVVNVSDPENVFISELTDMFDVTIRIEHNGTGYGSFKINRYSEEATAALLRPGNIVRVTIPQIDPDPIFAFILENGHFNLVDEEEEGGELIEFGGRGALAYWDRAIWLNESFLVPWWPQYIEDERGVPPAGTIGALGFAPGTYNRYTFSGGVITSTTAFTSVPLGFSSYYDRRVRVAYPSGDLTTLVRLTSGSVAGYWVKPWGAGVRDYRAVSKYRFGPSIAMSEISANQTPGEVIYVMWQEAQATDRPVHPLPLMTVDFDETTDSNGDPWTVIDGTSGLSADLGEDFLSTIGKVVNLGVTDVYCDPNLLMRVFNSYGRDLSADVLFAKGTNIADELQREFSDAPVATFAEVLGSEDGAVARVELADAADRPAREISVRGDSTDTDVLESLGLAELNARLLHSDAIGFNVATPIIGNEDPDVGMYLPGPPESAHGDYWIGDWVTLLTGSGEQDFDGVTVRIAAITIQFSEADDMTVSVEVNSGFGGFQSNGGNSGSSTGTVGGGGSGTLNADLFQQISERDLPSGYPSLDDDGLLALSQIPDIPAENVTYDPTSSGLTATDAQAALDELAASFGEAGPFAIRYTFDTTTTDADPGAGKLRLSNAAQYLAVTVRADLVDADGADVTALLDLMDGGYLRLQKRDDPTKWLVASVSAVASPSGYRNVTIANIAKSANSPFADGDLVVLTFLPTSAGGGSSDLDTIIAASSGQDIADALAGAAAPDAGNVFATMADVSVGGGSGALVLLEQHTASGSATLDFVASVSATYDEYLMEFIDVIPATLGAALGCRVSTNGGSTWDTASHYYNNNLFAASGTWAVVGAPNTYVQIAHNVHNAGILGVCGSVRFWPSGANQRFFVGQVSYLPSATDRAVNLTNSDYENGSFNALRFLFSSGNIASGTIRIYGIAK